MDRPDPGEASGGKRADRNLEHRDADAATADSIQNDFADNKLHAGPYGLVAEMGARATITLPPEPNVQPPKGGNSTLRLTDVSGRSFSLKLVGAGENF